MHNNYSPNYREYRMFLSSTKDINNFKNILYQNSASIYRYFLHMTFSTVFFCVSFFMKALHILDKTNKTSTNPHTFHHSCQEVHRI